jgi:hypothetical protein
MTMLLAHCISNNNGHAPDGWQCADNALDNDEEW